MTDAFDPEFDDLPDDDDPDGGDPGEGQRDPKWLTKIRADARETPKLRKQLAERERQLAMYQVPDLDRDHKAFALFAQHYDGDATPDAIRAEAEKYGLIKAPPAKAPPKATNDDTPPPDPTQPQTVDTAEDYAALERQRGEAALKRAREASSQGTDDSEPEPVDFSKARTAKEFFEMYERAGNPVNWG